MNAQQSRLDQYAILKKLGEGATAKVKLGKDLNTDNTYAIKILKNNSETISNRFREICQNEISSLQRMNHPNIVNLAGVNENGVYLKKNNAGMYNCSYLVTELCPNGELFDMLYQSGRFDERTARFYFQQLIEGLEACHNAGITHRDMKPENLLFDSNFNLKIMDFGFSILLTGRDGTGMLHTKVGTQNYMAPEIHAHKPYSGVNVDLFAAGIILFIMYSHNPPFGRADTRDPYYRLLVNNEARFWDMHSRNKPQNFYSEGFKDLIRRMLALEPENRPSISEIRQHPWFNGPAASAEEVASELTNRRQRILEAAERARQQRQRMSGNRPGIVYAGGRFYRGDASESEGLSLSFSLPAEDTPTKPVPASYNSVNKYSRMLTGLLPSEIMMIVSHVLANFEAECETDSETCEISAKVITETDSVKFKVSVLEAPDDLYMLSFDLKEGSHFDLMNIFEKVSEKIMEAQEP